MSKLKKRSRRRNQQAAPGVPEWSPGALSEGAPAVPLPASTPTDLPKKVGHWDHPEEG